MPTPCPSCGQPVIRARTVTNHAITLDAQPTAQGTVRLERDGTAVLLTPAALQDARRVLLPLLYLPHWESCAFGERRWEGP